MDNLELNVEEVRREYSMGRLSRADMPSNPLTKCHEWLQEALDYKVIEPTAVIVATVGSDGQPSTRTVLLKELDEEGRFVFYSNYTSRKGQQIEQNSKVSLTFLWHQLERQIHIEGNCVKAPASVSDAYFKKRSYISRIGARISPQSQPIPSRSYIVREFAKESTRLLALGAIPRPDTWGGYQVTPHRIEFWQGRESRLHDRFLYLLNEDGTWSEPIRIAP